MIQERIRGLFSKEEKADFLRKSLPFLLVFICLVSMGAGIYFYSQAVELRSGVPQKSSPEELRVLVDKVSQLILLPDETPTVATVNDLAPLKGQSFFAYAKIGDKVLIFPNAKKAILYSPETHKIIEVAPVSLDAPPKQG